ncbi:hypothetical protein ASG43_01930 [Aureimonas sp. Leaf454]|uniref:helix-turn-helix domain-containing protein n=1 Tax=Aureimonas sp. Leaf454 TaxID=1736381 RepID=UPI0006F1D4B2|nr:helix-turn-helix domain-containing protein [Aureimonas sp. Leaf454]KQT54390.1 hypothetical protein ASG43_01930 [Aureimonas sp. Leaf454]
MSALSKHSASTHSPTFFASTSSSFDVSTTKDRIGGVALAGQVLQFSQDCGIYDEGDPTRFFFKVVCGVVRTCKYRCDGRRQIDGFHEEGDVFGLESGATYERSAEAVSDCTLIAYRWHGLASAGADEDRAALIVAMALKSLRRAGDHALLLGRATAAEKVASFLVEIAARRRSDGAIDLVMCRQDIADYLALTIETVSRTMSQFERKGLIALPSARHVVLRDFAGLAEQCGGLGPRLD